MKKQFLASLLAAIIIIACNTTTQHDITGTYVRHTSDETGMLWDTMEISEFNGAESLYSVKSKSGVIYIRDGKDTLPLKNKIESFSAIFNEATNNFHIKELAADYLLDPKEKTISNPQINYEKID